MRGAEGEPLVLRKIAGSGVESSCGVPEGPHDLHAAAGVVPDIETDRSTGTGDSFHLGQRFRPVGHEIQHQSRGDDVAACGIQSKSLRVADSEPGAWVLNRCPGRRDETFRLVYRDQAFRIAPRQDGCRERPGPATDVQPIQAFRSLEPIEKAWSELAAPSPHIGLVAVAGLPGVMPGYVCHCWSSCRAIQSGIRPARRGHRAGVAEALNPCSWVRTACSAILRPISCAASFEKR